MNPRTRRAALYAIGVIAILASANALAHSYAGLYDWAVHHRLTGWQAMSWPAEIDVFLAVGELALYVAYLDGWPARQRIWPWATAVTGLAVSIAGNIGHIQAVPGQPVILADRLTAATSPVAAFAGLAIGLLVLRMTRQRTGASTPQTHASAALMLARLPVVADEVSAPEWGNAMATRTGASLDQPGRGGDSSDRGPDLRLLRAAADICQDAAARGERLSQRALGRRLREDGHRFPNEHLRRIAGSIGMAPGEAARSGNERAPDQAADAVLPSDCVRTVNQLQGHRRDQCPAPSRALAGGPSGRELRRIRDRPDARPQLRSPGAGTVRRVHDDRGRRRRRQGSRHGRPGPSRRRHNCLCFDAGGRWDRGDHRCLAALGTLLTDRLAYAVTRRQSPLTAPHARPPPTRPAGFTT